MSRQFRIPLHVPTTSEGARRAVAEVLDSAQLVGDGRFGRLAEQSIAKVTGSPRVLLVPSATAALELALLCLGLGPGDEVILPSFTFPSCANAVALRGATPVFCDIRADTLSVDLACVQACLSERTRAVMAVHYGGNVADVAPLRAWCEAHGLALVEDAAQCIGASLNGQAAGTFGHLGALSFHGTKNIGAGEAGALLVNDERWASRAEILREKGTDRARFMRGEVARYAWQDLGSSWVVSELVAAYLWGQLQDAESITRERRALWQRYADLLAPAERRGWLTCPVITPGAHHNGHVFAVLLPDALTRQQVQAGLQAQGIEAASHFVPLHSAPAGQRWGRAPVPLPVTESISDRLLRLPLWPGLPRQEQDFVVHTLIALCERKP